MEGIELEEGEACSYQNEEDGNVDLDALTYIDDKIQNVLGHFTKDFEGGVSMEYLGAKYGGYGSFLTQRSPVRLHSRSPANVQNNHSHKSLTCLSAEDGNHSSSAKINGPYPTKHQPGPIRSVSSDDHKAPLRPDPARQIARGPLKRSAEESTVKLEVVDKLTYKSDQGNLRVIMKFPRDNSSTKKNNAIYSGLGLASPSSSFGDSPMGSEGLPQEFQTHGDESPTEIIRIMTSLPINGDELLSPLHESLARFTEKLMQDSKLEPSTRHVWNDSVLGSNVKSAKFLPLEDGMMLEKKEEHLSSKRAEDCEKALDDGLTLKNRVDLDTEACEEMVAGSLRLPFLSNFNGTFGGERVASKQKSTADERRVNPRTDVATYPRKERGSSTEAANSSTNTDADDSDRRGRKSMITGINGSQKQNNGKISDSIGHGGAKLPSGWEQLPSGSKKTLQGSHVMNPLTSEIPKVSNGNVNSGQKDNSVSCNHPGKKKNESLSKQKDSTKAREKYKDFFGDMIEDVDDLMDSPDEPPNVRLKASQISENGLLSGGINSRGAPCKGAHEQLIARVDPKRTHSFDPPSDRVASIGGQAPSGAPLEDWVQCDKCSKWRLLPFGIKAESFPEDEKWLCSMLDWLPGMNNCSVSQEETTMAVKKGYQHQHLNGLLGSMADVAPGVSAANDLHSNQNRHEIFPGTRKNKHGLKDSKRELHSVKITNLTDATRSGSENELLFHHPRNSFEAVKETNQDEKKSKRKPLDGYSRGGHSENKKLRGDPSLGYARASRKIETEDEDWVSTRDIRNEISNDNPSNEWLANGTQEGLITNRASSSLLSSKGHTDEGLLSSKKKSDFERKALPDTDCLDTENFSDSNAAAKKRKTKGSLDALGPRVSIDEMVNDDGQAGMKRARKSISGEKASSSSRGKSRTDKKQKRTKEHRSRKDVGSTLEGLDDSKSLKRGLQSAATSSSSKVSESQKSKSNIREVKSSPVESVSSSPLRSANPDSLPPGIKKLVEKERPQNVGKDDMKISADLEDNNAGKRSSVGRKNLQRNSNYQSLQYSKDRIDGCFSDDHGRARHSLDPPSSYTAGGRADNLDRHAPRTSEALASVGGLNQFESVCNANADGFLSKQEARDSSRAGDDNQKADRGKGMITEFRDDSQDQSRTARNKARHTKVKFKNGNHGQSSDRIEKDLGSKNNSSGIMVDEGSKKDDRPKSNNPEVPIGKADSLCNHEIGSVAVEKAQVDSVEKQFRGFGQARDEEINSQSGKEKPVDKGNSSNRFLRPGIGNGTDAASRDAHDRGKGLRDQMSTKKSDTKNGAHSSASGQQVSRLKDRDAASPMRRDFHDQAAKTAVKEARVLKHLADRKEGFESAKLYFEAALKSLQAACLLESSSSGNSRRAEMIQPMDIYSSTVELLGFCGQKYEKLKDLASAALAYKCMEVACMKMVYFSDHDANIYRHKLQTSLRIVPPGESPSSSASDIDNASNSATAEKAVKPRDGNAAPSSANHVIPARHRPYFSKIMNFVEDVNSAMEASRKSRGAFAAAKAAMQQVDPKDAMACVKRALDCNFHDVNGLLRLVRLAMEAIEE